MFTGLISDIGTLRAIDGQHFAIGCHYERGSIAIGASIACDGCCLTVTAVAASADEPALFSVDVSNETLARTTLATWRPGRRINLERPLTLAAELGGHIVTGHVDGVAEVIGKAADGGSIRFDIDCPAALAKYIASKGSVALNGTSLTVNYVAGNRFAINLIPHTLAVSAWGDVECGDLVNLEVDLLARYVERLNMGAGGKGLD
jgi:riboflavin synthase